MTRLVSANDEAAGRLLLGYDSYGISELLTEGFRNLVSEDDAGEPFGDLYAYLFIGDDITEALAGVFHSLPGPAQVNFRAGLVSAFKRMNPAQADDQRAMKLVLRLGSKIGAFALLPHLTLSLFAERLDASADLRSLRSLAFDVAIELSGGASDIEALRRIALSSLDRPSAAGTLLLAMCAADPDGLPSHLSLLEERLVALYGAGAQASEITRYNRAILLTDLQQVVQADTLARVVAYSGRNSHWSLSWISDILFEAPFLRSLGPSAARKAADLLEDVIRASKTPLVPLEGLAGEATRPASLIEHREQIQVLVSPDFDKAGTEEVKEEILVWLLSGVQRTDAAARTFDLDRDD